MSVCSPKNYIILVIYHISISKLKHDQQKYYYKIKIQNELVSNCWYFSPVGRLRLDLFDIVGLLRHPFL